MSAHVGAGTLTIAGLGPGAAELITPEVCHALESATDIVGYGPYIDRVDAKPGQSIHASDNREELARARHALELAAAGSRVAVVSSGDPGVFAMAAAIFEAIDHGPQAWRAMEVRVLPGISAMLAAAARFGAPLGHDFCTINLSDNLKPWSLIEKRLRLALNADFAIALYNPRSKARPEGFAKTLDLLRQNCEPNRLIMFARAVANPKETLSAVTLDQVEPDMADMRTLVIVGSSQTRAIERPKDQRPWIYTPRFATEA